MNELTYNEIELTLSSVVFEQLLVSLRLWGPSGCQSRVDLMAVQPLQSMTSWPCSRDGLRLAAQATRLYRSARLKSSSTVALARVARLEDARDDP